VDDNKMPFGCILAVIGLVALLVIGVLGWAIFVPPYNTPKFQEIDTNQTGFLIPLDDDGKSQEKFESVEYLHTRKVASKRVPIVRRWVQKGWFYNTGEYMDTVRLVVVDRSPVIREWVKDTTRGSSPNNECMEAQSKDGTGLEIGFTVTALIPEEHTAEFLYWYRGDSLAHVMDKEIRARVQAVSTEFCTKYDLDHLRGHQPEMVKAVKDDIMPFFEKRGILITSAGLVGGFHYKNPHIQEAIDRTIQDQQLKVSAEARREAQERENKTIILAAEGKAAAMIAEAEGRANAIKKVAEAKAYELEQATKDKQFYLTLKTLDLEMQRLNKWNGAYPYYYFGMGGDAKNTPQLFMPAPAVPAAK
jgi:hypothetical protein